MTWLLSAMILATGCSAQAAVASDADDGGSVATAVERSGAALPALEHGIEHMPRSMPLRLQRLHHLYVLGVIQRSCLDEGDAEIERIRQEEASADLGLAATLSAYAGAYEVVRAKHAGWPFHKLSHVKRGLSQLDAAVRARPPEARIRYLRLTSCFPLPFFFKRGSSVSEDAEVLATLLADGEVSLPPDEAMSMVTFLLDEAQLEAGLEARLSERYPRGIAMSGETKR
jgi:predicted lipid carrier protein YhbT